MGIKNEVFFDAGFESVEKVAKKDSCEKSYQRKSDRKEEFFLFLLLSFRSISSFLGEFFLIFKTNLNSTSNFAFYDTHIEILHKIVP
jgi:hypothetical protein